MAAEVFVFFDYINRRCLRNCRLLLTSVSPPPCITYLLR